MIPAPLLYDGELVASGLIRCCRWFKLPFKRFTREVLGMAQLRPNFLHIWPLRPLERLFELRAEELLWEHTPFPYASAFLTGKSFELAQAAALDGGEGMPRLLAAMQNVSAGLSWRRYCPRCLQESLARNGESYWDRAHNLPGVFFCARHCCELVTTAMPARSTLKTAYELPVECQATQQLAPTRLELRPSKTLVALSRSSCELLERYPGPGEVRGSDWYRQLAIQTGWLSGHREVSLAALLKALAAAYPAQFLEASELDATKLEWAALCFRPGSSFNVSPLKQLMVETLLTSRNAPRLMLDHLPSGPSGTSSPDVDAFYAPRARQELRLALKQRDVLTTEQFLRRVGAFGPYRHRAEELPALRQVVRAFRGSPASVKQLRPGKTLYRNGADASAATARRHLAPGGTP